MYPDQLELLVDLKYLDISHNQLSELKAPQIHSNYNLRSINLAHNHFKSFPRVFFREQTLIKEIILDNNPLSDELPRAVM